MSAPSSDAVHVASVDLRDVARRTGCTQRELLRGIRLATTSTSAAGAIVAPAEHATFLTEYSGSERGPHAAANEPSDGVDVALVSLAARPGVLDAELPKCLLPIGSLPLIGPVLGQLHAGGVSRFVIVLGVGGATIRAAVSALPVARTARIEFIDLGPACAFSALDRRCSRPSVRLTLSVLVPCPVKNSRNTHRFASIGSLPRRRAGLCSLAARRERAPRRAGALYTLHTRPHLRRGHRERAAHSGVSSDWSPRDRSRRGQSAHRERRTAAHCCSRLARGAATAGCVAGEPGDPDLCFASPECSGD